MCIDHRETFWESDKPARVCRFCIYALVLVCVGLVLYGFLGE